MKASVNFLLLLTFFSAACNQSPSAQKKKIPVIGYLDMVEDETLAKARIGFFDALETEGFSEKEKTLKVIYTNAQGDIPALGQAADMLISQQVDLIASNTTLATITAVQRTKTIPVCMMVAPRPDIAGLTDKNGNTPSNLFGVYETLEYIDTAISIINIFKPGAQRLGTLYNQSEPQSRDAFARLEQQCKVYGWELFSLPVNNSSETQLATAALLRKKPDVFFALPDNVIFASFETIVKLCNDNNIPVFTSEAGLTARGAVASFGADFYEWGFQAGMQAAAFLKNPSTKKPLPEIVFKRTRIFNSEAALRFGIKADSTFVAL
ncbi:MAG: ABC transporter substrate-binding protein [Bacteroidia bacterium]|nr:ABC transporter substrate-binding protein [Bacteroidia bacterium]